MPAPMENLSLAQRALLANLGQESYRHRSEQLWPIQWPEALQPPIGRIYGTSEPTALFPAYDMKQQEVSLHPVQRRAVAHELGHAQLHAYAQRAKLLPQGAAMSAPRESIYRGKVSGAVRTVLSILKRWQIGPHDAATFLGFETSDRMKDLQAGTAGLDTRDAKDRACLLVKIYEGVHNLFREAEAERAWINAPLESLNNRSLIDIMRRGSIEDLLYANSFVDHVSGR